MWWRHQTSLNVSGPWMNAAKGTHVEVISRFPHAVGQFAEIRRDDALNVDVLWKQEMLSRRSPEFTEMAVCAEGLEGLP